MRPSCVTLVRKDGAGFLRRQLGTFSTGAPSRSIDLPRMAGDVAWTRGSVRRHLNSSRSQATGELKFWATRRNNGDLGTSWLARFARRKAFIAPRHRRASVGGRRTLPEGLALQRKVEPLEARGERDAPQRNTIFMKLDSLRSQTFAFPQVFRRQFRSVEHLSHNASGRNQTGLVQVTETKEFRSWNSKEVQDGSRVGFRSTPHGPGGSSEVHNELTV